MLLPPDELHTTLEYTGRTWHRTETGRLITLQNKGSTDMITQAVEQIRNTVSLSVLDESATKQGVVLNLLRLAGWDTFDVSQVVPEYRVGTRRVDYALRPGSPNAVFIEVKRPGEKLERHQQQLLEYCFQEGVKMAVLTNGRTWWLYLPLQAGSWQQRRFLTIDLEVQEPSVVERLFLEYLSPEQVGSGQAVADAEDLVESQQRAEIIGKTIAAAWTQIVETPDELLVDLISETTERICGFKPEPELVKQFLAGRAHARNDALNESPSLVLSRETNPPSAKLTRREGRGPTLPITLDPQDSADFLDALLRTKEAWLEVSYSDGRKEVRRWDASLMSTSSNVIGNLRSRPEFRNGTWQKNGIASLRVSVEHPRSKDA